MGATGVKSNKLTNPQLVRLVDWFRKNQETIKRSGLTQETAAIQAAQALGFPITTANIGGVASEREDAVIQFVWPRSESRLPKEVKDPRVTVLIRVIESLRMDLGHDLSGPLAIEWEGLLKQSGV